MKNDLRTAGKPDVKNAEPLLMVAFREVRHDQPDDVLHYEPVNVRGELHHWTIPAHRHDGLHQFQLLTQGGAEATLDGRTQRLEAPAALLIAPGVVHGFVYDRHSAGHQVTLPSALLRALLGGNASLLERLAQTIVITGTDMGADAAECEALFVRLRDEFQLRRLGRGEALQSHATLLGLWFLQREEAARATLRTQALRDTLVQRFRHLVDLHFREQQPVSFYAAELDVTADHLSRVCRGTTGLSALDLLHQRVELEARRLLAYTPAAVIEVAHELGFDDPAYFSRFFTKTTGHSPTAYRQALGRGTVLVPEPAKT
ncbi:MAG: helix-turn-helix domain-containing protein [Lysobacteraceae bacterium]|nr:MAG: helix-turn-helix domain-containing protein [Xanthomonadaceae bacterium]